MNKIYKEKLKEIEKFRVKQVEYSPVILGLFIYRAGSSSNSAIITICMGTCSIVSADYGSMSLQPFQPSFVQWVRKHKNNPDKILKALPKNLVPVFKKDSAYTDEAYLFVAYLVTALDWVERKDFHWIK